MSNNVKLSLKARLKANNLLQAHEIFNNKELYANAEHWWEKDYWIFLHNARKYKERKIGKNYYRDDNKFAYAVEMQFYKQVIKDKVTKDVEEYNVYLVAFFEREDIETVINTYTDYNVAKSEYDRYVRDLDSRFNKVKEYDIDKTSVTL